MFVADNSCPLDVDSIVWYGIAPPEAHNYIVVRKADSKNGILYALQEELGGFKKSVVSKLLAPYGECIFDGLRESEPK